MRSRGHTFRNAKRKRMLDEMKPEREGRESVNEREAVRKMGVGGFCRHGALRLTPVPSALTYFQPG